MNKGPILCGIDEAGRGAWAGPLVAAAIILQSDPKELAKEAKVPLKDGKLLKSFQREKLYEALKSTKSMILIEIISTRSINNHNIGWANVEAMKRLIKKIEADHYIVDGKLKIKVRGKTNRIQSVIDADATIPEVILAGIVAKAERDNIMKKLHIQFPHYNWKQNAGYGTREHQEAIVKYRTNHYHRSVFVTTGLRKYYS